MLAQIISEKTVLVVVTLIGMAICSVGIGQVAAQNEWLHPMAIMSYVLGGLALVIVGAALFNINLPLISSPRAALIAVILIALFKVGLTQVHRAFA